MTNFMRKVNCVENFLKSANEAALESKRLYRRTELLSARCAKLVKQSNRSERAENHLQELWKLLEEERLRELEATRFEIERYHEVEAFIDQLEDAVDRTILRRRFLDVGLSWVQIQQKMVSDGMYYSERQLYRHYKAALAKAQVIWDRQHCRREETVCAV